MKKYAINEVFYSLQGEGARAGTANVFVRFQGCNLHCVKAADGFDCDTEFASGTLMTLDELITVILTVATGVCRWVVLTGGEPLLQTDEPLIEALHNEGFRIAVETNGTKTVPAEIDWITISPKVAEHAIAPQHRNPDEVKYVRHLGQAHPHPSLISTYYFISPAFDGNEVDRDTLKWCIGLVKGNTMWRLSLQQHKIWGVR